MNKWPSIGSFKHVVEAVTAKATYTGRDEQDCPIFDRTKLKPILQFYGTVKLHGTNASISRDPTGKIRTFSREREITPSVDNHGFSKFIFEQLGLSVIEEMFNMTSHLTGDIDLDKQIVTIYGEWVGPGIAKGTAVNKLSTKSFFIFGISVIDAEIDNAENLNVQLDPRKFGSLTFPAHNIYNIVNYPTYQVDVDFNNPKTSIDLLEKLTNGVEQQCPVGSAFGLEGIGEGIVWRCITTGWDDSSKFWFKVKGEKHKVVNSKQVSVDPIVVAAVNDAVDLIVTENRLIQGIEQLKQQVSKLDISHIVNFIKWVVEDSLKEEVDILEDSNIDIKQFKKAASTKARNFFMTFLNDEIFS